MKFFLKDKKIQVARIILLLIAGAVLGLGMVIAFNLKALSSIPVWMVNAFIVVVTVYAMKYSE